MRNEVASHSTRLQLTTGKGLAHVVVSSVRNANAVFHAEKFALSLRQEIVPFGRESIVGINLENQAGFSIVSKQGMSVDLCLVVSASMPALSIENQHTPPLLRSPEKHAEPQILLADRPSHSCDCLEQSVWNHSSGKSHPASRQCCTSLVIQDSATPHQYQCESPAHHQQDERFGRLSFPGSGSCRGLLQG